MIRARTAPAKATLAAFGGTAVVLTTDPRAIGEALDAVRGRVAAVDRACSRFRPDSELSAVNAAAGRPVEVGELFALALRTALRAADLTSGDVDPTCGDALIAAGYDRDFAHLHSGGIAITVTRPRPAPGWRSVSWDAQNHTVLIPEGARLDFGATAKALAADLAAADAHAAARCGVLVSFSGDMAVCGAAPEGGWRVRVTDDHRGGDESPGQTITLAQGGLATSSTTVRRWRAGASDLHHILDPRTGAAADSCWRTASVAAASCVDANTAATAAIVRGAAAVRWLAGLGLPARLVRHDGSAVTLARWPADDAYGTAR